MTGHDQTLRTEYIRLTIQLYRDHTNALVVRQVKSWQCKDSWGPLIDDDKLL